jgi:hypothetical protein
MPDHWINRTASTANGHLERPSGGKKCGLAPWFTDQLNTDW